MMNARGYIICFFCALFLTFCQQKEEQPSPLEKLKEIQNQIAHTWTDYNSVFKREEIDSVMTFFTERCIIMPDYGFTLEGKEELKEMFIGFFENNSVEEINRESIELMIHRDDIFEIGELEQLYITSEGDTILTRSRYLALFQMQEDGRWKFHRWFNQPEK